MWPSVGLASPVKASVVGRNDRASALVSMMAVEVPVGGNLIGDQLFLEQRVHHDRSSTGF